MIPSGISTLGVLGTFFGITVGLLCFDTNDLQHSIPELLSGLKTAFFTSLAGMVGSLILSRLVNRIYDEITEGISDINQAAALIVKSVKDLSDTISNNSNSQQSFFEDLQTIIEIGFNQLNTNASTLIEHTSNIETNADIIATYVNDVAQNTKDTADACSKSSNSLVTINSAIDNIESSTNSITSSLGNVEEYSKTHSDTASHIDSRLGELLDHTEAMVNTENEVSEKITGLTDKLHGEVIDIEDKMAETNTLLSNKFDEFSVLLQKNNTEALIAVMQHVTEEFQTQMNALISKLVQENFEQLNTSVENLNRWQVENKDMISSLILQYKQMADNFEGTSDSLTRVKNDTQSLVSDGGKLDQLVKSLNEVIVKDEKFKSISNDLQKVADLSKSNMESFDQSTRQLNDWIKKQRNFSDTVAVLIQKLEELNEMRNYASTFWQDTRTGMNEAVGIVKEGTKQLNEQITEIDSHFYSCLSTTLSNLDSCIQSLVTKARNNN
jgi:chromosome segregation ATPase